MGAAHYRKVMASPSAQPVWWAWPVLSVPLALMLTAGCVLMVYHHAWPEFALLLLLFWPTWALMSRSHYRAWRKHRETSV
jgi:hypothetical protein